MKAGFNKVIISVCVCEVWRLPGPGWLRKLLTRYYIADEYTCIQLEAHKDTLSHILIYCSAGTKNGLSIDGTQTVRLCCALWEKAQTN